MWVVVSESAGIFKLVRGKFEKLEALKGAYHSDSPQLLPLQGYPLLTSNCGLIKIYNMGNDGGR